MKSEGGGGEALPAVRSARLKLSLSLLMFLRISGRLKVSEREREEGFQEADL